MNLGAASGTFPASGIVSVTVGPTRAHENWRVKQLATSSTSGAATQLKVYRNVESASSLLDQTARGNGDVSECNYDVPSGQRLIFVWNGGTVGTTATCAIEGDRY